ncbi:hypothetical protein C0992_004176 [Termitomyces sp. T32_za158]|nr:hypothetical protein C0992_004176 [Termitomyces sp. T32_za158]
MQNHLSAEYSNMHYEYTTINPQVNVFQSSHYNAAPNPPTMTSPYAGPRRRTNSMRKTSPDSLISMDAPTQPRNYVTPSATSRKEVPAFFYKMRNNSPQSEEEMDELTEEPPASNATDQEKIDYKRRQNTLAARRSRKRKIENVQRLEETVERLTREREIWKTRALTLKQLLISHGIICPEFRD